MIFRLASLQKHEQIIEGTLDPGICKEIISRCSYYATGAAVGRSPGGPDPLYE